MLEIAKEVWDFHNGEIPDAKFHGKLGQYNWILWKCKDGRRLAIYQMEDTHLIHAEAYLQRNRETVILRVYEQCWDYDKAVMLVDIYQEVMRRELEERYLMPVAYPTCKGEFVQ